LADQSLDNHRRDRGRCDVIVFDIHLERADTESGVAWWADSDDVPGFYAVSDSLAGLRGLVVEVFGDFQERLVYP